MRHRHDAASAAAAASSIQQPSKQQEQQQSRHHSTYALPALRPARQRTGAAHVLLRTTSQPAAHAIACRSPVAVFSVAALQFANLRALRGPKRLPVSIKRAVISTFCPFTAHPTSRMFLQSSNTFSDPAVPQAGRGDRTVKIIAHGNAAEYLALYKPCLRPTSLLITLASYCDKGKILQQWMYVSNCEHAFYECRSGVYEPRTRDPAFFPCHEQNMLSALPFFSLFLPSLNMSPSPAGIILPQCLARKGKVSVWTMASYEAQMSGWAATR